MFHFAAPDVNGLGVRTLMPGLSRSSQVWMFFGLPLRTMSETTDFDTRPLCALAAQSSDDQAGLDQARHVGREREGDDVGGQAGLDRAALVARGAEGLREADALARAACRGSRG